jgi:hypothetical protein
MKLSLSRVARTSSSVTLSAIFILLILVAFASCSSEPSFNTGNGEFKGPNGEHFDANVDGMAWYPQYLIEWGDVVGPGPLQMSYNFNSLDLQVSRGWSPTSHLTIILDSVNGTGSYILADSSTRGWANFSRVDTTNGSAIRHNYITSSLHSGTLIIQQIDTTLRLISGAVNFEASSKDIQSRDSVLHCSEGTFISRY